MADLVLILSLIIILIGAFYSEIRSKGFDVFSPYIVTLIIFALMFIIKPIDMLFSRDEVSGYFSIALFYVLIGFILFEIGYHVSVGKLVAGKIGSFPAGMNGTKAVIASVISAIAGFILYIVILHLTDIGGIIGAYSNIWNFRIKAFSMGMSYLTMFMQYFLVLPMLVWFVSLTTGPKNRFSVLAFFSAYFLCLLVILTSFGSRGMTVSLILSLMIAYNYLVKKIPLRRLFLIVLLMLSFVAYAGLYRAGATEGRPIPEVIQDLSTISIGDYFQVIMGRLDPFPNFVAILEDFPTSNMDFQFGRTYLNFLLQPVPRSILPEKPLMIGDIYTQEYFPDLGWSKDPSIFGELYMNFHIAGIVIGMFLFGVLCRICQEYLQGHNKQRAAVIFYALIIGFPGAYLMAGISSPATLNFLFSLAFSSIFFYLIREQLVT